MLKFKKFIYLFLILFLIIMIFYFIDNIIDVKLYNEIDYTKYVGKINEINRDTNNNYVGFINIPKLKLIYGFYDMNDINNNVNKNIEVIENSMLNNNRLIIAGHSGNTKISYFRNLEQLSINDYIYVYYNDKQYTYKVSNMVLQDKVGKIKINKENNMLVLTTCSMKDKTKQFILISKLVDYCNAQ